MKQIVLIFITFSLVTAHVARPRAANEELAQSVSFSDVSRIVGGDEAVPNSIPYQVAMRLIFGPNDTSFCGGSLISVNYVLTVSHCLNDGLVSLEVILGAHNYRQNESTQQRIPTDQFKMHENFNITTLQNDVGIVHLPTPAVLNEYVQLIALPSRADVSNNFVGSQAITSGWGYVENSTEVNDVLMFVKVPIISNEECQETFGTFLVDTHICSGGDGLKGVCDGDSGGPLVVNGTLIGITSFIVSEDCSTGAPSAYTRVTSFLDWISENSDVVIY